MNNTGKHTPGPWKMGEDGEVLTDSPNEFLVAMSNIHRPQYEANARLIAAAPELLEALKDAKETLENAGDEQRRILDARWDAIDILNDVLSRAEGRTD